MRGEVLARRRRAFEDHECADMHVRGLLLLMEKRRVDGAQAVPVALVCHGADSTRHNRLSEAPGNSAGRAGRARRRACGARGNRQRPLRRRGRRRGLPPVAPVGRPLRRGAALRPAPDQVALGPRPAGSQASRRLAETLRRRLPDGRFQAVPGGLRNVMGTLPGREPAYILVGAHYDTKDIPGFVGANDGASGVAVVLELARRAGRRACTARSASSCSTARRARPARRTRGSRRTACAAAGWRPAPRAGAGDRPARHRRRPAISPSRARRLWTCASGAAARRGGGGHRPVRSRPGPRAAILDDHSPFLQRGVPAIDLIDFGFRPGTARADRRQGLGAEPRPDRRDRPRADPRALAPRRGPAVGVGRPRPSSPVRIASLARVRSLASGSL